MVGPHHNEQLAQMNIVRPTDVDLWRSQVVLEHTRPGSLEGFASPLPTAGQETMLGTMLTSAKTAVVQAKLQLLPVINHIVTDLTVEARSHDEALQRAMNATVDGMVAAGVEVDTISPVGSHLADFVVYSLADKPITLAEYKVDQSDVLYALGVARNSHKVDPAFMIAIDTAFRIGDQRQPIPGVDLPQAALKKTA